MVRLLRDEARIYEKVFILLLTLLLLAGLAACISGVEEILPIESEYAPAVSEVESESEPESGLIYETQEFSDAIINIAHQTERIEDLYENIQTVANEYNMPIQNIRAFADFASAQNDIEISEGNLQYGMIVKVYYGANSWVEFLIHDEHQPTT